MPRTVAAFSLRTAEYLVAFVLFELLFSSLLRWETAASICFPGSGEVCFSRPPAVSDATFAALLLTAMLPLLAFAAQRAWSLAPFGFGTHAVVLILVLFGLPTDRLGVNGAWDGGMDLAVSLLAFAFVVGAGPAAEAAAGVVGPHRRSRLWRSYTSGRFRPQGTPALSAKIVALGFGLFAAGFATLALFLASPNACTEVCLAPTPSGAEIAGFAGAVSGGLLAIAAASDRRMSGAVLVGLGVDGLATLFWIPSWSDPGWLMPEGAAFAFVWLLLQAAIFYLVLRPSPSGRPANPPPPAA